MAGRLTALGNERGGGIATVLLALVMLSGIGLALTTRFEASRRESEVTRDGHKALYIARAGFERSSLDALVGTLDWSSVSAGPMYGGPVDFAGGTYEVELENVSATAAEIVVTGKHRDAERTIRFHVSNVDENGDPASTGGSGSESVVLDPTADTWITSYEPSWVNGTDPLLRNRTYIYYYWRYFRDSAIQFDLTSLPEGTVSSATLRLRVTYTDGAGQPVGIRRVTVPWSESTANWYNLGEECDWGVLYASFTPSPVGFHDLDVTSLVDAWNEGTYTNYGFMVLSSWWSQDTQYASREHGTSSWRPTLTVDIETEGSASGGYVQLARLDDTWLSGWMP